MTGTALLALAHGSADDRHAAGVRALAAATAGRRPGLVVRAAFLEHSLPSPLEAVAALRRTGHDRVVLVPLLLTAAHHGRVDVPAVADRLRADGASVEVADVLGPDPLLVDALEHRVRQAGVWPGDPGYGVVLAAAGTSDPAARAGIEATATAWRGAGWAGVEVGYASGDGPSCADAAAALLSAGTARVVVAAYFVAEGMLLDRARAQVRAVARQPVCTSALSDSPAMARLVLGRHDQLATARSGLRATPGPMAAAV